MKSDKFIVSETQQKLDMLLVPYDLWSTKVHVLMLSKQKIIDKSKAGKILQALSEIGKELKEGEFAIDPNRGLHLTVEAKVIEKIGDDGYFMHTARSRNDQIATCELLYLKEKVLRTIERLLKTENLLTDLAASHIETVMPGYTHMQPAKPTTFAQWCLSYRDMLGKCLESFKYQYGKYNLCPLGAVESYGTSWRIDRRFTASLLGFSEVWEIPQEAISSRGFAQLAYLGVLKDVALAISKIAGDLLLFTTHEFGYITLSDETALQMGPVTGSSIMPQKKNPDVLELLRSIVPQVIGYESIVANLLSCLPMGYNRDSREVKEYIESGFGKVDSALDSLMEVFRTLRVNKKKMEKSVLENFSLSADLADFLSQSKGLPYRKVYQLVGILVKNKMTDQKTPFHFSAQEILETGRKTGLSFVLADKELKVFDNPLEVVMKRKHIGGANRQMMLQMIKVRQENFKSASHWLENTWLEINSAKLKTVGLIGKINRE